MSGFLFAAVCTCAYTCLRLYLCFSVLSPWPALSPQCDEDTLEEMRNFKKCLLQMFHQVSVLSDGKHQNAPQTHISRHTGTRQEAQACMPHTRLQMAAHECLERESCSMRAFFVNFTHARQAFCSTNHDL